MKTSTILSIFWLICIAQANKALSQKQYKTQENYKTNEILQSVGYEVLHSRFARITFWGVLYLLRPIITSENITIK